MIEKMTENVAVHQTLADEPNGEDGLTAQEVKAKFDQAAVAIQRYLNETVVPAVNAAGGVKTVNGKLPDAGGNVTVAAGEEDAGIPAYWQEALQEVCARVRALQDRAGPEAVSFVFFTDVHWGSGSGRTGALAAALLEGCDGVYALCGGDLVRSGIAMTKAEMEADFQAVRQALEPLRGRLLTALGNHDGSWGPDYGYNFSPEELYGRLFRGCPAWELGGDGSYYYADDRARKVRFVVLNSVWCRYGVDGDGAALYPRQNNYGFGQDQLDWLVQRALRFEEPGWALVLMTHVPVHSGLEGKFRDYQLLTGILNAFVSGGTYQGSYGGSGLGGAIAPDYTNLADPADGDWKAGYRISSSGAVTAAAGVVTTNFIPAVQGQTLHIKGLDINSNAPNGEMYGRISFYDGEKNFLDQINPNTFSNVVTAADYDGAVKTYTLTLSNSGVQMSQHAGLAYVRVTGLQAGSDGSVVVTVDQEIRNKTTGAWDAVQVDVDFTGSQRADLVGCFCGHLHRDLLAKAGNVNVAVTTCDADLSYDPAAESRSPGTARENALDVVTVNRRTRTVALTRLGPGEDRTFTY